MTDDDTPALLGGRPAFPAGPPDWPPPWPEVADALAAAAADGSWGRYHGPHVARLEHRLRELFDVPHALTCASGTLAVEAAMHAVGVRPGDDVVLAAYEYEASFLSIHARGAVPVLVDVAPATAGLDPGLVEAAVTPKTKAVLVSHLHGGLAAVPDSLQIPVIEDAAQCPGAVIAGRPAGSRGRVGTLSFGGSKLLTAGRGGALLFRDAADFQRAKLFLSRGVQQWAALSELQAAVLLPQLDRLEACTQARLTAATDIAVGLRDIPLSPLADFSGVSRPAFYKFGFVIEPEFGLSRDRFCAAMRAEGVAFDPGFRALHVNRSPSRFRSAGPLPHAAEAGERIVTLHHPVLLGGPAAAAGVVRAVRKIYRNAKPLS